MPKKRGKRSSTANRGAPDGTRGRKGKKTQKSVRLTNFDEARNFLHGVALTPEAFYAKDENMSKSLLQCVKLYFDHDKKRLQYKLEMIHKEKKYLASTIEILSLYVDLGERKVSEFENEKIQLMDQFIHKHKGSFSENDLKFSSKLKK